VAEQAKTRPTAANVEAFLAAKVSPAQRAEADVLLALFGEVTGKPPTMWGPSIVGFGTYRYKYESGRVGESCQTGFSVRGREWVVYVVAEGPNQEELRAKLGKHKMGKACLYFKQLSDIDVQVLRALIQSSLAELARRPTTLAVS
jgi:hypothetical protein